jgi:hypothetical protein
VSGAQVTIIPNKEEEYFGNASVEHSARLFQEHQVLLDLICVLLAGVTAEQVGQGV